MPSKPKCFGEYESKNDICEKCRFVDPCEVDTIKSKRKPKEKDRTLSEDDKFFRDILNKAATKDPAERYYGLYKKAKAENDKYGMQLWLVKLSNALDNADKPKEEDTQKLLNDLLKDKLKEDPVDKTLKLVDRLGGLGGKSDIEAITGAVESLGKDVTGTVKEVFGRKKLGKVLEDEKYANEWSKCGDCGQMINHPDPKSCPNCGATAQSGETSAPEPESIPTNDIDCFGTYDAGDLECQNCPQSESCIENPKKKGEVVTGNFQKVDYNEPLPEGADEFIDDIHRICEWVQDGVNAKTNTTTLYMLGVGKRMQKGKKPRKSSIDKVKGSLLASEIGMDKLLEIASQFSGHPEAQELEIDLIIKVLSSKKGQGFIHSSWSTLNALAEQDGIALTDEERESMIADINEYSTIKLNPEDYFKGEPESEEPVKEKPEKKKPAKKKPKPKKKKDIKAKKKAVAESTKTKCPVCKEEMMISELRGHLKECKG